MNKIIFLFIAWCMLPAVLQAQKPELVLPAIHSMPIQEISFSADGRFVATCAGSEIKLWELNTGRLVRTIQSPVEIEHIALSEDGTRLVSGSFCGISEYLESAENIKPDKNTDVRFWDMVSGKTIRILKEFGKPIRIYQVEISSDMRYALARFEGKIAIWEISTGKEVAVIPGNGISSFAAGGKRLLLRSEDGLKWVDWASGETDTILADPLLAAEYAGGVVIVVNEDGQVKHWNTQDKKFSTDLKLELGREPSSFGFSPGLSRDGTQFGLVSELPNPDPESYNPGGWRFRVWNTQSGVLISNQTYTAENISYRWGQLSRDLRFCISAPLTDVADVRAGMKAYSTLEGTFSHAFGLTALEATTDANLFPPGPNAVFNQGKFFFINREEGFRQMFNTVFFPQTGQVITGVMKDSLIRFAEAQPLVEDKRWSLDCVNGLLYNLTDLRAGKVVASLLLAESFPESLYDEKTGTENFKETISHAWAVTTPGGLFDASPDMMKSLHFSAGMEIIDLDQLKERYYEPGLLGKLLGLNQDPLRSVEAFDAVALYPEIKAAFSTDKQKLDLKLISRSGGIGKLSVFVNGKEVLEDANPQRAETLSIDLKQFSRYYLPGAPNTLALRVYNKAGWLKSQALEFDYLPPAMARGSETPGSNLVSLGKKPGLYALVVGTANYTGSQLDLQFADRDATYISQALLAAAPKVFGDRVQVTLLNTDAEDKTRQGVSSKASIRGAFADIASKAQAQDILVLYFSGHGVNYGAAENAQFYYLTKDIASENLSDPEVRNNYTISSMELTEWIKSIPALKQVMILDACNAGKIVEDLAAGRKDLHSSQIRALDRMKDRTGMFILTGSAEDKVSYEAGQYGQGLLTYSLLQGMSGLALTEDKRVDVMTLFQYSRDKVPELARGIGGIQTPILAFPANGASFDIGIVDAQVKIPVAQIKPVFIRNNFQEEEAFEDVLGLTAALADFFRNLTAKGAQAEIIYVDVPEYENAYSIKGRYTVKGEEVEVRGRLFKGKTGVGEFQVIGKKGDLPGLVEMIVEKVSGMIR